MRKFLAVAFFVSFTAQAQQFTIARTVPAINLLVTAYLDTSLDHVSPAK